jgi:hypothetical protein
MGVIRMDVLKVFNVIEISTGNLFNATTVEDCKAVIRDEFMTETDYDPNIWDRIIIIAPVNTVTEIKLDLNDELIRRLATTIKTRPDNRSIEEVLETSPSHPIKYTTCLTCGHVQEFCTCS